MVFGVLSGLFKSLVSLDLEELRAQAVDNELEPACNRTLRADSAPHGRNGLPSPIARLPVELILEIGEVVGLQGVGRMTQVCKKWQKAMGVEPLHNKTIWDSYCSLLGRPGPYERVTLINRAVWEQCFEDPNLGTQNLANRGIDFEDERLVPADARRLMEAVVCVLRVPTEAAADGSPSGVAVITIPRGLTWNNLRQLVGNPIDLAKATTIDYMNPTVWQEFSEIPVESTHFCVVTKSVVVGSRNQTDAGQTRTVNQLGCQKSNALFLAAVIFLSHISARSETLYGPGARWTSLRCAERTSNNRCLLVGGFSPAEGLHVEDDRRPGLRGFGVAAQRKVVSS